MAFKINTITGLEYLPGLIQLNLLVNNLTNIDVSQNTNLEDLNIGYNQFTDEGVNNLVLPDTLIYLYLYNNQIVNFNPITALPSGLQVLQLQNNQIVTFNPTIALPNSLEQLYLNGNQIVTFNPTLALPNSLLGLDLAGNQIVSFNPSVPLPNSLQNLYLYSNQMTTAGYTASEPWANAMSVIPARGQLHFTSNPDSVTGTNLETIVIDKGWSVYS